jgi:NADH-quinone oxidoreductase subunit A
LDLAAATALILMGVILPPILYLTYRIFEILTRGPDRFFARLRYEAGNPPRGLAWPRVLYHYFGYILLLVAIEPIFLIAYTLAVYTRMTIAEIATWTILIAVLVLPPLYYAVRYASKREYWEVEV